MTLEERVQKIESRMIAILSGGTVLASCLLAFFAYEKWLDIPSKVQAQFADQVGAEKVALIESVYHRAKGVDSLLSQLPIGSIIPWHKDLENTPPLLAEWVECNGQRVKDKQSAYFGHEVPDLNGTRQFVRGGSKSGVPEEQDWKSFSVSRELPNSAETGAISVPKVGKSDAIATGKGDDSPYAHLRFEFNDSEVRPINTSMVWIIKIR